MGVKYDAVKDNTIKIKHFRHSDFNEVIQQINNFLDRYFPRSEWEKEDDPLIEKGHRIIPLGIAHSTEVVPYTGAFGLIETRITYHAVLTYQIVDESE